MTHPRLTELDRLTIGLPAAANAVARAAQVLVDDIHRKPPRCPWCLEDAGWCRQTGGPNPCEGHVDAAALVVAVADAPTVHIRAGGAL